MFAIGQGARINGNRQEDIVTILLVGRRMGKHQYEEVRSVSNISNRSRTTDLWK